MPIFVDRYGPTPLVTGCHGLSWTDGPMLTVADCRGQMPTVTERHGLMTTVADCRGPMRTVGDQCGLSGTIADRRRLS